MNKEKENLKMKIIDALQTVYDPEIPVSVYELGLIYDINISKDNDVSNDIESIDTTNSILALKEYRHFFQYLFVNKKLSSVNDIHSNEKKKRISSMMKKKDGKALTLLICSDLKEMPTKKNDIFTLSGALAL